MLAAVCFVGGASAKIVLPKVLGSNMVLQQNSNVNLWGKADANAKVAIVLSWDKTKIQTTADKDGNWAVKVPTPKGSFDPQTITISDGEKVVLENVLIGDVWVTSGQSNMEMPVKGFGRQPVEHSYDYILSAAKDANRIRMFTVKKARSYDKDMEDCAGGEWFCSSPQSVAEMRKITRKGDYALGWARYHENTQTLVRTGTMSGTCAYIEHTSSGISYAFITNTSNYRGASFTNSLGRMIHTAMSRVQEWPTDRDLFVEVPSPATENKENTSSSKDV